MKKWRQDRVTGFQKTNKVLKLAVSDIGNVMVNATVMVSKNKMLFLALKISALLDF